MRTIAERLASIRKEARSKNAAGVLNEVMLLEGALAPVVIACACCGVATASGTRTCPSCGNDPALGARREIVDHNIGGDRVRLSIPSVAIGSRPFVIHKLRLLEIDPKNGDLYEVLEWTTLG